MPEYELLKDVSIKALEEAGACERELHRFAFLLLKRRYTRNPSDHLEYDAPIGKNAVIKIAAQCKDTNGTGVDWLVRHGFIKERESEVFYHIGQHFKDKSSNWEYVLAAVGGNGEGGRRSNMNMINVSRGSHLGEPVMVEDFEKIGASEMNPLWNQLELIK